MTIKAGDKIKIKREWQDDGDDNIEFIAIDDQDGDRVWIGALGVLRNFTPTQIVSVSMLDVS